MNNVSKAMLALLLFSSVIALSLCWTGLTGGRLSDMLDLFGRRRMLALQRTPDGHTFRVLQYWNGIDFYTTELQRQSPQGELTIVGLDADDDRREAVPLSVDERKHTASVQMGKETVNIIW